MADSHTALIDTSLAKKKIKKEKDEAQWATEIERIR